MRNLEKKGLSLALAGTMLLSMSAYVFATPGENVELATKGAEVEPGTAEATVYLYAKTSPTDVGGYTINMSADAGITIQEPETDNNGIVGYVNDSASRAFSSASAENGRIIAVMPGAVTLTGSEDVVDGETVYVLAEVPVTIDEDKRDTAGTYNVTFEVVNFFEDENYTDYVLTGGEDGKYTATVEIKAATAPAYEITMDDITVDLNTETEKDLTATVTDTATKEPVADAAVTFALKEAVEGVTVEGGKLTVDPECTATAATIVATYTPEGGEAVTKEVAVTITPKQADPEPEKDVLNVIPGTKIGNSLISVSVNGYADGSTLYIQVLSADGLVISTENVVPSAQNSYTFVTRTGTTVQAWAYPQGSDLLSVLDDNGAPLDTAITGVSESTAV